jgi:hypothetical protein
VDKELADYIERVREFREGRAVSIQGAVIASAGPSPGQLLAEQTDLSQTDRLAARVSPGRGKRGELSTSPRVRTSHRDGRDRLGEVDQIPTGAGRVREIFMTHSV